jgi:cell division septal protein FtsQ
MNLLSGVESKSFRTFTLFSFVVLITLALLVSIFSNKYRVSAINYDYELNLNYEGLKEIEKLSIWLVNDDNFEKFYLDNPNVESLEISKQLPNVINININLYQKIIVYTDFRDTSPEQKLLYKNLYTADATSEEDLAHLVITNGPIADGFYSEIVSFILTVEKYEVDLSEVSMTFDGDVLAINYLDTIIDAGKAIDLSRKGTVVGYILEKGDCKGRVTILQSSGEDIETLFEC